MRVDCLRALPGSVALACLALGAPFTAAAQQPVRPLVADAAERQDLPALRALLAQGADANLPQADGATALHWAVHWNDLAAADALIRGGALVDALNDLGVFPLSLACANGSVSMVERLIAAGASVRQTLPSGESALMSCARTGAARALQALLAHGADVEARERHRGQTALMWAAGGRHAAAVKVLIGRGADPNAAAASGFTPLMFAAREGDPASAQLLVAAGARINDTTPDGESALLIAAASVAGLTARDYRVVAEPSGHEAVATVLIERGANINQADKFGMTALHHAVETRKPALLKTLVARGVELNARLTQGLPFRRGDYVSRGGYGGATAFWLAAMHGEVEMMRTLAAAGADWRLPSRNGTTPLMVAAGLGQTDSRIAAESRLLEAVKFIVALGGNVNEANGGGQTAAHGAATISGHAIISYLAQQGAVLDVKDKGGRTPIDLTRAVQRPRPETEALLRQLIASRP
jgi:ankyrin repeat protein